LTTVPTGRLCDTDAEKNARLRRGSKLRSINKGTIYDVSGKLRKIVHEIESGKHGDVTDVVLALRCVRDKKPCIHTIFCGTSQPEVLHYMACRLEKETN
jgi:hypothetical protein